MRNKKGLLWYFPQCFSLPSRDALCKKKKKKNCWLRKSDVLPPASKANTIFQRNWKFWVISVLYHHINMFLKCHTACLFAVLLVNTLIVQEAWSLGEVLWAVNAGGEGHTDIHGIRYQRDYLTTGIASGKMLLFINILK